MKTQSLPSVERERDILAGLSDAIEEIGADYVLPFRFRSDRTSKTSHHLIFVCKHFRGYEKMKEIMAEESSEHTQGVASFESDPSVTSQQQELGLWQGPLDRLKETLLEEFAGQELRMRKIYELHSVNRPYIARNYKQALLELETEGRITASKHKKGTFGDNVLASFPRLAG